MVNLHGCRKQGTLVVKLATSALRASRTGHQKILMISRYIEITLVLRFRNVPAKDDADADETSSVGIEMATPVATRLPRGQAELVDPGGFRRVQGRLACRVRGRNNHISRRRRAWRVCGQ